MEEKLKAQLIKTGEESAPEGHSLASQNYIVIRGIMGGGKDLTINIDGNDVRARDDVHLNEKSHGYQNMGDIEVPDPLVAAARAFVEAQKALNQHESFIKTSLSI